MKNIIKGDALSLYEILTANNHEYKIPNYQRPYTWGSDNVKVFFEDFIKISTEKFAHYLGPVYFFKHDTNVASMQCCDIVDGQQRITTFYIFMLSLQKFLFDLTKEYGNSMCVDIKDDFITNFFESVKFTSNEEDNKPLKYIREHYRSIVIDDSAFDTIVKCADVSVASSKLVVDSFLLLYNLISNYFKGANDENENITNGAEKQEITIVKPLRVMEKTIKTKMVVLSCMFGKGIDEVKVFDMFEIINDRGVSLSPIDKVKNLYHRVYFNEYFEKNPHVSKDEIYKEMQSKWSKIISVVPNNELNYFIDSILVNGIFGDKGNFKKNSFYKDLIRCTAIKDKSVECDISKLEEILTTLYDDRKIYAQIIDPYAKLIDDIKDVERIQLLYCKDYKAIRPLMYFIMKYIKDRDNRTRAMIIAANFAIRYIYLSEHKLSYAETVIKEVIKKLRSSLRDVTMLGKMLWNGVNKKVPGSEFNSMDFLKMRLTAASDYKMNNYILCKLNDSLQSGIDANYFHALLLTSERSNKAKITAEHLFPQKYKGKPEFEKDIQKYNEKLIRNGISRLSTSDVSKKINNIGNLLPLRRGSNSKLSNKEDKLKVLASKQTKEVLENLLIENYYKEDGEIHFSFQSIEKRSKEMADYIIENDALTLEWGKIKEL